MKIAHLCALLNLLCNDVADGSDTACAALTFLASLCKGIQGDNQALNGGNCLDLLSQACPLPDRSEQAAFSRATALLEAVAGNAHTPLEDRVFLAETMPFPNILVKLSTDESVEVRKAVAGNANDKNWLVGRLTKDESLEVRDVALRNKQTSWKMRLEGAQDPGMDSTALDFLGSLGVDVEPNAPAVLASMVRRAVALNPNTSDQMLEKLAQDASGEVKRAAERHLSEK